ncbi:MAG: hypothetical protein GY714_01470 [Desulfobacterales bacterium]|nr:hypothetical protein [Desulfobacterales bacterium]
MKKLLIILLLLPLSVYAKEPCKLANDNIKQLLRNDVLLIKLTHSTFKQHITHEPIDESAKEIEEKYNKRSKEFFEVFFGDKGISTECRVWMKKLEFNNQYQQASNKQNSVGYMMKKVFDEWGLITEAQIKANWKRSQYISENHFKEVSTKTRDDMLGNEYNTIIFDVIKPSKVQCTYWDKDMVILDFKTKTLRPPKDKMLFLNGNPNKKVYRYSCKMIKS